MGCGLLLSRGPRLAASAIAPARAFDIAGPRRACEPSNLWATSLRYQARIVSGRATFGKTVVAPIIHVKSVAGDEGLEGHCFHLMPSAHESESFSRPFNWAFRMRFSAARYSMRASSSAGSGGYPQASLYRV